MLNTLTKQVKLAILAVAAMLVGCDAKVDFGNIDPTAKVEMGVALPIGEISATVGDFIGDSTLPGVTAMGNGVYQFEKTINFKREFHKVDLTQYFSTVDKSLNLQENGYTVIPTSVVDLYFPLVLPLSNVNTLGSIDSERLDKMVIDTARFSSNFSQNFGLSYDAIKKVEIILPNEHFTRQDGNVVNVPIAGYGYNQEIPVIVDNFTIDLTKDPSQEPGKNNVDSTVTFQVHFQIQSNSVIVPTATSAFDYRFTVQFMEYSALYGIFKLSSQLNDQDTVNISDIWSGWDKVLDLKLPLHNPTLTLDLTTSVAAPLIARIDNLGVIDLGSGEEKKAHNFNGIEDLTTWQKTLDYTLTVDDPIDATVTNHFTFDRNNGALDELFLIRPDVVYYKYDFTTWDGIPVQKQHRLTRDTKLDIDANIQIPFTFDEGLYLSYTDTMDLSIDKYSLDSLVADVDIIDSLDIKNLEMVITAKSWIPFDVKATVHFLDENYQPLNIVIDEDNEIIVKGPSKYNGSSISEPGESFITVKVGQEDLDLLAQTKHILYKLEILDVADNAKVNYPVELGTFSKIKLKLALSADVAAYLRLEFDGEKGGNE